jgi:hypothetical protein
VFRRTQVVYGRHLKGHIIEMATKRVSKSAVDWIAFGKQLPKSQVDGFRAFKGKTDNVLSR